MSRTSELEIAQGNRLNELIIAEHSRQKDRDLATDQQRENILVEYQKFLAQLLITNGLTLKDPAKAVALFMSRTTLNQLNANRKRHVIRSLYEAKLITLNLNSKQIDTGILDFGGIDLSDIILGSLHDPPDLQPRSYQIDWYYLYLPRAILRNASFRHAVLNCATLFNTNLDSADLSFAFIRIPKCFANIPNFFTDFTSSSLVNASLYNADFYQTSFYNANLTLANMFRFRCVDCEFSMAIMDRVDLSHCYIDRPPDSKLQNNFHSVILTHATAHAARFYSMNFDYSDWSYVQASEISMAQCTFMNATMISVSFVKSNIRQSLFQNANLSYIDLSYAILNNVSFVNVNMHKANLSYIKCDYCIFTNVDLRNSLLKNASLRYTNFLNCLLNDSQLEEAIDLTGSRLPNGTIVRNNN